MYSVYAIRSELDGRIYVGFTDCIERRIKEHNSGKTKSTKGFIPWRLIFSEKCESRKIARMREKYYKSGCGKEFLKQIKIGPVA